MVTFDLLTLEAIYVIVYYMLLVIMSIWYR